MTLDKLFNPQSIAIIGASNTAGKVGYAIVKNLIGAKFGGDIFPINLKEKEIQGLKAFSSVSDVEENIDLAILAIPARFVPDTMKECAKKNIKNAIIVSAGFSEVGKEGIKLEEEVEKIVSENNMNVVGPNTLGVINSSNGLNASFAADFPKKGDIALVSQSGALCTAILDWAKQEQIGFSKFISTGNKGFLDEGDYFSYLENDDETKAVFVYMESVKDSDKFLKSAYALSKKKPIILIKSGRSAEGQKAAFSHTGAISGDDNIFSIACQKTNILRMDSIEEFFDMARLLSKVSSMDDFGLAIITNAGGPGVITTDSVMKNKLLLPQFSKKTLDAVQEINPCASNPLDLIGDATPADYKMALDVLKDDDNIDLLYVLLTPQSMAHPEEVAKMIVDLKTDKPIVCSFLGGAGVNQAREYLQEHDIAQFDTPERGIKAISDYKEYCERKKLTKSFEENLASPEESISLLRNKETVAMEDAFSILKDFGIATCKTEFVVSKEEFDNKIKSFEFPIAMKASSGIPHKTDLGLVKWDIKDEDEARKIFGDMQKILSDMNKPESIAIQEMVNGQEVLVSSITNEFGKVITYGLGGIFVEVMKDVSQKIAPINDSDIAEMLAEVKGTVVLEGARTKKKYNIDELKKVIKNISLMALSYPEIKEIEINPLIINENGAYAIDALMSR